MNLCDKCKVNLSPEIMNCPLCGKHVDGDSAVQSIAAYPAVDRRLLHKLNVAYLLKIILLCATVSCVVIDLLFSLGHWWSIYVVTGAVTLFILVLYPVGKKRLYWKNITLNTITILLYTIFIDFFPDSEVTWSVTYVSPVCLAVFSLSVTIVIFATRKAAGESLLGLLIVLIISLVMFLLGKLIFVRVIKDFIIIPSFIALLTAIVMFTVLVFLRRKEVGKEMFKKFRF